RARPPPRLADPAAREGRARSVARAQRARSGDPGDARQERRAQHRARLSSGRAQLGAAVRRRCQARRKDRLVDALVTNVDRTAKNPNMLRWHKQLYLIDHGAALYFHHAWPGHLARAKSPFAPIRDHALLPFASSISDADAELAPRVTETVLRAILGEVPDDYFSGDATRDGYVEHLLARLAAPRAFAEEAERARRA